MFPTPLSRYKTVPLPQKVHFLAFTVISTFSLRKDNVFHHRLFSPTLKFHINEIILFRVQLLSLSIMTLRLIHVVHFSVQLNNILQYGHITICLPMYLLRDVWVVSSFRLFELSCSTNILVQVFRDIPVCFHFSWVRTQKWNSWIKGQVYISLYNKLPNSFLKWFYCVIFTLAVNEYSSCSKCLLASDGISLFNFSHSVRYVMVFHCYYNLHFPDVEHLYSMELKGITAWGTLFKNKT